MQFFVIFYWTFKKAGYLGHPGLCSYTDSDTKIRFVSINCEKAQKNRFENHKNYNI